MASDDPTGDHVPNTPPALESEDPELDVSEDDAGMTSSDDEQDDADGAHAAAPSGRVTRSAAQPKKKAKPATKRVNEPKATTLAAWKATRDTLAGHEAAAGRVYRARASDLDQTTLDDVIRQCPLVAVGDSGLWAEKHTKMALERSKQGPGSNSDAYFSCPGNKEILSLYKGCWRLMQCLPEDIIGTGCNMRYDTQQNKKANNYIWSGTFCAKLNQLLVHDMWGGDPNLLALAIQYAHIIDTEDPRPWRPSRAPICEDPYLASFLAYATSPARPAGTPMERLRRSYEKSRRRARPGLKSLGPWSALFARIEAESRKGTRDSALAEEAERLESPDYLISIRDLKIVIAALNSMGRYGWGAYTTLELIAKGVHGARSPASFPKSENLVPLRKFAWRRECELAMLRKMQREQEESAAQREQVEQDGAAGQDVGAAGQDVGAAGQDDGAAGQDVGAAGQDDGAAETDQIQQGQQETSEHSQQASTSAAEASTSAINAPATAQKASSAVAKASNMSAGASKFSTEVPRLSTKADRKRRRREQAEEEDDSIAASTKKKRRKSPVVLQELELDPDQDEFEIPETQPEVDPLEEERRAKEIEVEALEAAAREAAAREAEDLERSNERAERKRARKEKRKAEKHQANEATPAVPEPDPLNAENAPSILGEQDATAAAEKAAEARLVAATALAKKKQEVKDSLESRKRDQEKALETNKQMAETPVKQKKAVTTSSKAPSTSKMLFRGLLHVARQGVGRRDEIEEVGSGVTQPPAGLGPAPVGLPHDPIASQLPDQSQVPKPPASAPSKSDARPKPTPFKPATGTKPPASAPAQAAPTPSKPGAGTKPPASAPSKVAPTPSKPGAGIKLPTKPAPDPPAPESSAIVESGCEYLMEFLDAINSAPMRNAIAEEMRAEVPQKDY
jgi:hypothetical protein